LKKIFLDSAREARDWELQNAIEQDQEIDKKLQAEGAKITVVSEEAKKPMIRAAEEVWKRFRTEIREEYFTEIEKAKAAVRAR
jgi:TRAP-type C4-dicarboxylate transport system substrate-binding protein